MSQRSITNNIKAGALICALYVALGAFGAHGLKPKLSPSQLATYETGLRYLIIHGMGIILVNLVFAHFQYFSSWVNRLFYAGILLFSGGLVIHGVKDLLGIEVNVFAMLAPLGGLCFIAGWLIFLFSLKNK